MHRVAISEEYRTSPALLRRTWTFADLFEAHVVLDVLEEARAIEREAAARSAPG